MKILISILMITIFSQFGFAGNDSSGGTESNPRAPINEEEIGRLLHNVQQDAEARFHYLRENKLCMNKPSPVLERIYMAAQNKSRFFLHYNFRVTAFPGETCANGKAASYKNGRICFDPKLILLKNYSKREAPAVLMSMYLHELGHVAGYGDDPASEATLWDFQLQAANCLTEFSYDLDRDSSAARVNFVSELRDLIRRTDEIFAFGTTLIYGEEDNGRICALKIDNSPLMINSNSASNSKGIKFSVIEGKDFQLAPNDYSYTHTGDVHEYVPLSISYWKTDVAFVRPRIWTENPTEVSSSRSMIRVSQKYSDKVHAEVTILLDENDKPIRAIGLNHVTKAVTTCNLSKDNILFVE